MEVLIGSPPITKRVKGIRTVKNVSKTGKVTKESDAAHTKLFHTYLNDNAKNKNEPPKYKLGDKNNEYYSNLLRNVTQLQYMNMVILSQVLLYLNSRNGEFSNENFEEDISIYIDNLIGRDYNSNNKNLIKLDLDKEKKENVKEEYLIIRKKTILRFFAYIRFIIILKNNKDREIEKYKEINKKREKTTSGRDRGTMIHPHYEDQF